MDMSIGLLVLPSWLIDHSEYQGSWQDVGIYSARYLGMLFCLRLL
jgi:hypothetical protein